MYGVAMLVTHACGDAAQVPGEKRKFVPHVIEPSLGATLPLTSRFVCSCSQLTFRVGEYDFKSAV